MIKKKMTGLLKKNTVLYGSGSQPVGGDPIVDFAKTTTDKLCLIISFERSVSTVLCKGIKTFEVKYTWTKLVYVSSHLYRTFSS